MMGYLFMSHNLTKVRVLGMLMHLISVPRPWTICLF